MRQNLLVVHFKRFMQSNVIECSTNWLQKKNMCHNKPLIKIFPGLLHIKIIPHVIYVFPSHWTTFHVNTVLDCSAPLFGFLSFGLCGPHSIITFNFPFAKLVVEHTFKQAFRNHSKMHKKMTFELVIIGVEMRKASCKQVLW